MIKAPFNFVPLNEKVYFPDWADKISHDIPFEDGESGVIELTITAKSPIFVRNGHTKEEADNKTTSYKSFSNINGKYFIPGTTIKGAVRNVLEIMSFGKMNNISNSRFSLRDLKLRKDYLDYFPHENVHCGWMSKEDDVIHVTDHGIPRRISHSDLDDLWETNFVGIFRNAELLKNDSNRMALYKINLAKGKNKEIKYDEFPMNSVNKVDNRIIAEKNSKGKYEGTIVLTGQPSARRDKTKYKKASGKCFEFVFPKYSLREKYSFKVNSQLFKDFCFIYKESEDWKYWRIQMERGERVPVFFSKSGEELIHFGLSYLYKLPYTNRIKDLLPKDHNDSRLDFCECLFGSICKEHSLRGRVQFSNAFMEEGKTDDELLFYMASPNPTYYPIYLKQRGEDGYMRELFTTMMSKGACLKGWKRYPIREGLLENIIPEKQDENSNSFIPMKAGTAFKCKIRFHNLRKVEIGALLRAVDFTRGGFHSIGFAKPYGFGKVRIDAEVSNSKFTKEEYIDTFLNCMRENISNYDKSQQLSELNLMSSPQKLKRPLEYMELSDFVSCKTQNLKKEMPGEYLEYYSKLIDNTRPAAQSEYAEAIVNFVEKQVVKAKLNNAELDKSYDLKVSGNKRPKKGNKIKVKIIRRGGKIDYLLFEKILK